MDTNSKIIILEDDLFIRPYFNFKLHEYIDFGKLIVRLGEGETNIMSIQNLVVILLGWYMKKY